MSAAVRLKPSSPDLLRDLITLLVKLERWPDAAAATRALLELDPQDAGAWLNLAQLDFRLLGPDFAARTLESGLTHVPGDAGLDAALANVYVVQVAKSAQAGDLERARAWFERLEARYPTDPRTIQIRAALGAR